MGLCWVFTAQAALIENICRIRWYAYMIPNVWFSVSNFRISSKYICLSHAVMRHLTTNLVHLRRGKGHISSLHDCNFCKAICVKIALPHCNINHWQRLPPSTCHLQARLFSCTQRGHFNISHQMPFPDNEKLVPSQHPTKSGSEHKDVYHERKLDQFTIVPTNSR